MDKVINITGERLLDSREVAEMIGTTAGTLAKSRLTGGGEYPSFIKIGSNVRYKLSTVVNWIAAHHEYNSTSEHGRGRGAR